MSGNGGKLSGKEERFCLEYVIDYNGAAAARRTGYAPKSAKKAACRLLQSERIVERIHELQKAQAERLCLGADLVVVRAMELYEKCTKAIPVREWDTKQHKMVDTGEYRFDSTCAVKCLEMLGRYIGMFDRENRATDDTPVFIRDDIGISG